MDRLWTPWRYAYVSQAEPSGGCLFCEKAQPGGDEEKLVLRRGGRNFILLNLYPYTNGHIMIAPYEHVSTLGDLSEESAVEMMRLARLSEQILRRVYHPKGVNIGMNVGECAGAGVAAHIHLHLLPRWPGDVSFMTTVGETRVIPEDLATTYAKLSVEFAKLPS
jgi:ATP adenylyltransferase